MIMIVDIPGAFVWTKIQADAGETVERILNRKELERLAGGGSFWWGIGESKAQAISLLAKNEPRLSVLFSRMASQPLHVTAPQMVCSFGRPM